MSHGGEDDDDGNRHSVPDERASLPELTENDFAELEARNGLIQADLMLRMIDDAVTQAFRLRPSMLADLQEPAVVVSMPT